VLYIVIVTPRCNLNCTYCGGTLPGVPADITYDLDDLADFIAGDRNAVVAFYGGEPLLRHDIVKDMLDVLPARHFVLQTNGYLLHKLERHVHQIDSILLSVDGRQETTDAHRGDGCYAAVMKARNHLRDVRFSGEVIARMAATKKTDIFQDVTHLLAHFPYVHWQFDAVWSGLWDLTGFAAWLHRSYEPGIARLIDRWFDEARNGRILGIVPFLGILTSLLHGGSGLPCEAGTNAVTISTDGTVMACPIAPDFEWNVLGTFECFRRVHIGSPCTECSIYRVCGGRCLFAYKERLWGREGFDTICATTKHLVDSLAERLPTVSHLKDHINYPPYNNTTEIIP
jgi:putative peptide-modifying radical SAM enzyme